MRPCLELSNTMHALQRVMWSIVSRLPNWTFLISTVTVCNGNIPVWASNCALFKTGNLRGKGNVATGTQLSWKAEDDSSRLLRRVVWWKLPTFRRCLLSPSSGRWPWWWRQLFCGRQTDETNLVRTKCAFPYICLFAFSCILNTLWSLLLVTGAKEEDSYVLYNSLSACEFVKCVRNADKLKLFRSHVF
jgi:hypothetical protein